MTENASFNEAAASWLRLQSKLIDANTAQFQAGMSPALPEDTSERSKGVTSDPTFHAVADERRIKLRAAFKEAEQAQMLVQKAMAYATKRLEKALAEDG